MPVLVHSGDACATSPPFARARLHLTLSLTIPRCRGTPIFISHSLTRVHTHAELSRFSYIHSGVHVLVRAHRFAHIRHELAFDPKRHTSTLSRIFLAIPFSVYGRRHCSRQAQHESASPVQPQLARLKEGRLG